MRPLRPPRPWLLLVLAPVLSIAACGGADRQSAGAPARTTPTAAAPAPATPPPAADPAADPTASGPLVVFLGDSLTAGLGLAEEDAYPALLADRLRAAGRAIRVVNAGISGDTTAGGRERLSWLLRQRPDVLVVALGANDGLRGQPLAATEENLRTILREARAAGAHPLLCGMQMPPNYGPEYAQGFAALYPRLAVELEVPLVPFLLDGVGGVPELNQADGIHPTADGQRRVADNVEPHLVALLDRLADAASVVTAAEWATGEAAAGDPADGVPGAPAAGGDGAAPR